MSLKIGSLVFAVSQGLGILAKEFHRNGIITHPLVIRHGRRPENDDWFPGAPRIADLRRQRDEIMRHCAECDVVLFLETAFDWTLIRDCRNCGIPTACMPMYECMPKELQYHPDLWLCPSLLDLKYYPDGHWQIMVPGQVNALGNPILTPTLTKSVFLPVPVDVPWKQRTRAEVFVHNAGWGGLKGRNGTAELLEAWAYVESPARLIIRSQEPMTCYLHSSRARVRPEFRHGTFPAETLWDEADAFLFPEKFNGLSLPLQEARAAGMLVMASNRFPMNTWLPTEPLIPVSGYKRSCVSPRCHEFEEAIIDPRDIARTIDQWYGADISEYSRAGREWAKSMSWEVLGPKYREVLHGLVNR